MPAESGGQAGRRAVIPAQTQSLVTASVEASEGSTACPPDRLTAGWVRLRRRMSTGLTVLRRLVGMPDYQAFLEHLRRHHPECPIPSEREYFTQYIESRYGNGPSRCC